MRAPGEQLEDVLSRLEAAIHRLADGSAPLDRLVANYEEAGRLADEAERQLKALTEKVAKLA